ncbi:hypothetical protein GPJ56_007841 [Histomonas meleagridis]|uniref:uncharacterized protein n=1 Tax=Histomonas meleagridis TaxID=135588 RepID=UPI003559CB97|nr:hypothetical protein GPJ56_007841 [Histomonas meleagridis]KAH0804062.1 hypothetical protein GO595_002892 [Histomonas meleagridis]
MCLSLVYCALSSNGFIDYAQESPLYQTLIEMVKNVSCEELLKLLVAIFYKLIKVNFEVVEDLVPRFIDLIGSSFEKVSFGATLIIKKILKDEPDWVQQEKHHYLADNLMKKISDSSFERKRMYLKCLLRLLRIVSRNFLKELTNKKLVGMLMEFLDFGYDADLTDTILDLLKSLVNMEFEECGTLNLMDEIMENGGEDTLKQFLDCEDEEAAELATKLLNLAQ